MAVETPPHVTPTAFRQAVMDLLEEVFPGTPVLAGRVDGPVRQRSLFCVWPISRIRLPDHVIEENVTLGIRAWVRWRDQKDADRPRDTTELETLSETLLIELSKRQQSLGVWQLDVVATTFEPEMQGIELIVAGRQWNPFAMCE